MGQSKILDTRIITKELGMEYSGILGFLYLIVVIYAILQIVQSSADNGKKALWIAIVLVIPVIGPIAWYFLGPGGKGN
jgi:Na+-driven multidrug efflux pump